MADPWLLVDSLPESTGAVVSVDGREGRHGKAVLRLKPGDDLTLANGKGGIARGVVESVARGGLTVQLVELETVERPAPGLVLALGVLHTQAMDWAVQKAVEVGVERFVPLLAGRSQVSRSAAGGRIDHWRRVARQALKQCHRPWQMEIDDPADLHELVDGFEPGVVADPAGMSPSLMVLGLPATLVVGPEGGLTAEELGLLDGAAWRRMWLGTHVLRAETAATVGSAVLILRAGKYSLPPFD